MKPLDRNPVRKGRSAAQFRNNVRTTHPANMNIVPMRGGWRM